MSYFDIIKTMISVNYFARCGLTAQGDIRSMSAHNNDTGR